MRWLKEVCVDILVLMILNDDDDFKLVGVEEEMLAGMPG